MAKQVTRHTLGIMITSRAVHAAFLGQTQEVLWMDSSSRAAIKNGNTEEIYQMMWEGGKAGMITLEQDLLRLTKKRLITPETAIDYANNKRRMQQLLR